MVIYYLKQQSPSDQKKPATLKKFLSFTNYFITKKKKPKQEKTIKTNKQTYGVTKFYLCMILLGKNANLDHGPKARFFLKFKTFQLINL